LRATTTADLGEVAGWEAEPDGTNMAIREPAVPVGVVADTPGERRWQRIPSLLHMRAVKP